MKKLAIFVEGPTEEIFVEKLLLQFAKQNSITFKINRLSGTTCPRAYIEMKSQPITNQTEYYILIYTSCTDNRVASDYKERYNTLIANGYNSVLALRDLYPIPYENLQRVEDSINAVMSHDSIPNNIHIAIREVETWFLGEYTHFNKIHADITLDSIKSVTGYEFPLSEYEQTILHPADTLNAIYKIKDFAYKKTKNQVNRTVDNFDYEEIYCNVRNQIPSLNKFLQDIDLFFT